MGIRGGEGIHLWKRVARRAVTVAGWVALAAACGGEDVPLSPSGFIGAEVVTPMAVPDLTFTDQDGEPFPLRERTAGRVALIFFGYTNCPDICPVHLANLAAVLDKMNEEVRRQVMVIFVTTDPARDTLPRLGTWVRQFDRTFIGLTGPDSLIQAAELALGVAPSVVDSSQSGVYEVGHAAQVVAATRDGMARVQYPFGTRQRDWAHDLPRLVAFGD
jgi:protein SCO1/2